MKLAGLVSSIEKTYSRTPQGVRGLKRFDEILVKIRVVSHSARSAWIETLRSFPPFDEHNVALRKECVD